MDISVLNATRVMAIIRHDKAFDALSLLRTLSDVGIKVVEFTCNTPDASQLIQQAVSSYKSELVIGAGTVLSMNQLFDVLDAGAQFIVSPIFRREIVAYCSEHAIPVFPGALTPTEIYEAWDMGAYMVKVFPAQVVGPSYFASLKGPFPEGRLLAVGGINSDNCALYLSKGADAVAIGSGIIKSKWLDESNFAAIKNELYNFMNSLNNR